MSRADRRPAYLSRASLAHEIDCAESTIDEMVKRGVLPRPIKLSAGCVRWSWEAVVIALASLKDSAPGSSGIMPSDPFMRGALHVTQRKEARCEPA